MNAGCPYRELEVKSVMCPSLGLRWLLLFWIPIEIHQGQKKEEETCYILSGLYFVYWKVKSGEANSRNELC